MGQLAEPYGLSLATHERVRTGNVLDALDSLPEGWVHTFITSPPYFNLRQYAGDQAVEWPTVEYSPMIGVLPITVKGADVAEKMWHCQKCEHRWTPIPFRGGAGNRPDRPTGLQRSVSKEKLEAMAQTRNSQATKGELCDYCAAWRGPLGLEPTVEMYVGHMVLVFRYMRRVLRDDGVIWLVIGDSYASDYVPGISRKNLLGVPWRVALALQADGWFLRADPPWVKCASMPESIRDRPTLSHEHIFLLSKQARYYYDQDAIRKPYASVQTGNAAGFQREVTSRGEPLPGQNNPVHREDRTQSVYSHGGRTYRSSDFFVDSLDVAIGQTEALLDHLFDVRDNGGLLTEDIPHAFVVNPRPSKQDVHFAVFPPELVEVMIRASTSEFGVCPKCGDPWKRVTKRATTVMRPSSTQEIAREYGRLRTQIRGTVLVPASFETVGWRPTCDCYDLLYMRDFARCKSRRKRAHQDATGSWWKRVRKHPGWPWWDTVPSLVADPFAGSGTTCEVATLLGRAAFAIDISEEYCALIREVMDKASQERARALQRAEAPLFDWAANEALQRDLGRE